MKRTFKFRNNFDPDATVQTGFVPSEATWSDIFNAYSLSEPDPENKKKIWKKWTKEGWLYEISYNGKNEFTIARYHPDGTLAEYSEHKGNMGTSHGFAIKQRSESPTTYEFFSNLTPLCWKVVQQFKDGKRIESYFFDKAGNELTREQAVIQVSASPASQPAPAPVYKLAPEPEDYEPWPSETVCRKVTFNEAMKMLPGKKRWQDNDKFYALIIDGNIHCKDHLILDEIYLGSYALIVVNGNLTIDETFCLASGESGEPYFTVLGNMTAKNILFGEADIEATGDISVKEMIFGCWEGSIKAGKSIQCKHCYGPDNYFEAKGKQVDLENITVEDFLPEYIETDEDNDSSLLLYEVMEAIRNGEKVLQ